jgi:hypothetical protein
MQSAETAPGQGPLRTTFDGEGGQPYLRSTEQTTAQASNLTCQNVVQEQRRQVCSLLLSSLQNKASTFGKTCHTGIRASDTPDPTEVQPVTRPRLIRAPSPSHSPLCQADQNTPLTPALLYQPQSIFPAFLVPNLHINYALTFDPRLHPGLLRRRSTQGEIVTYNINGAKNPKQKAAAYSACWRKPAINK